MAGCFIVIDGIDGSGKKTQLDLLKQRLAKEGYQIETADFPQYGSKSAGPVEEYLNGNYGTADEVGPYPASILYAVDRFAAAKQIREWLSAGKIVLSNRYVSSNMGHQGGKIADSKARQKFFAWNDELEYSIFAIPRPDITIVLHLPPDVAQSLVDKKENRAYLNGAKRDIHENNLDHLRRAEETYLEITKLFPGFALIECYSGGQLLTPEQVHEKILAQVQSSLPKA